MDKYEQAQRLQELLEQAETEMADIPGFEGKYAMTKDGQVWSYWANGLRATYVNGHGYVCVDLHKNGKVYKKRVNILMAEAWNIPKPDWWSPGMCKLDVAHQDDNKLNNSLSNLFWKTRSENLNTEHWKECAKHRLRTPIRCVETGVVYKNQAEAAKAIGKHKYGINNCLLGKQKTCGGYHWERVLPEAAES